MGWLLKRKEVAPSTMHNLLVESFGQVRKDVQNVYDWLKFLYNQTNHQQQLLEDQRKEIQQLRSQVALMPQNKEEVRALIDAYYDLEPLIQHVERMEQRIEHVSKNREPQMQVSEVIQQAREGLTAELAQHVTDQVSSHQSRIAADLKEEVERQVAQRMAELEAQHPVQEQSESEMHAINSRLESIQSELSRLGERAIGQAPPPPSVPQVQQVVPQQQWLPPQQVAQSAQRPMSNLQEKMMRSLARNSKDYVKNTILGMIQKYQKITGLQLREILVEEQGLVSRSSFYRLLGELENETQGLSVIEHGKEKIYIIEQPVPQQQA